VKNGNGRFREDEMQKTGVELLRRSSASATEEKELHNQKTSVMI